MTENEPEVLELDGQTIGEFHEYSGRIFARPLRGVATLTILAIGQSMLAWWWAAYFIR